MDMSRIEQVLVNANRRFFWRLGRRLYMTARSDFSNDPKTNGENRLQQEILNMLRRRSVNPVIFDVGANIGDWTLSLIRYAQAIGSFNVLTLHAFEPVPSTFNTLSGRLQKYINGRTIRCNKLALSCEDGETYMFGKPNSGISSLHRGIEHSQYDKIQIARKKVETYADENSIKEIHLLKCDTEGHDCEVIKGALGLLKNGKIWFFQFEYSHMWVYGKHYLKDVFDLIEGTHYKLSKVTPNGLEIYENWEPELERFFENNYVLLRDDLINQVKTWSVSIDLSKTFA